MLDIEHARSGLSRGPGGPGAPGAPGEHSQVHPLNTEGRHLSVPSTDIAEGAQTEGIEGRRGVRPAHRRVGTIEGEVRGMEALRTARAGGDRNDISAGAAAPTPAAAGVVCAVVDGVDIVNSVGSGIGATVDSGHVDDSVALSDVAVSPFSGDSTTTSAAAAASPPVSPTISRPFTKMRKKSLGSLSANDNSIHTGSASSRSAYDNSVDPSFSPSTVHHSITAFDIPVTNVIKKRGRKKAIVAVVTGGTGGAGEIGATGGIRGTGEIGGIGVAAVAAVSCSVVSPDNDVI